MHNYASTEGEWMKIIVIQNVATIVRSHEIKELVTQRQFVSFIQLLITTES
jgi:hypothetical protein